MEPDSRRSSSRYASDTDEWEDEQPEEERGSRRSRPDPDYRHMQTLEFEDDEYIYYVEATPKRGGRQR